MGRIKSTLVKRTAKELIKNKEAGFNESFEDNKKLLVGILPSKRIRNRVAGYIARLKRMTNATKQTA